jgi:hypothetical protein
VNEGTLRILMIGNSYTFFNDMPQMLGALLSEAGRQSEVAMSALGGWTLENHVESQATRSLIALKSWDYVVLQEQSVIPSMPDEREQRMLPAARALAAEIRRAGAQPVLFMTWGRRDGLPEKGHPDFEAMQAQLVTGYRDAADAIDARVAPVGLAWQWALASQPGDISLTLWDDDGSHPAPAGSYLAACVFVALFCETSPEGLAYDAGLPAPTARFLRRVAADTTLPASPAEA